MLPTTQAALEALVGRALTAPESALAQGRRDADLAASLSAGRSRTAPTLIGYGAVMLALDEAKLAAEAADLAPAFRRDAAALAARNADLTAALLDGNRAAWRVPLGFDRFIGRRQT